MTQSDCVTKRIGEYTYYIHPFGAFTCARLSGKLGSLAAPILAALGGAGNGDSIDVMNLDVGEAANGISNALGGDNGAGIENLIKDLIIKNGNVFVEGPGTDGDSIRLDFETADRIFCCEFQDMIALCIEVIKLNFGGFFKKLGGQFGGAIGRPQGTIKT